jgi:hypothetical protein
MTSFSAGRAPLVAVWTHRTAAVRAHPQRTHGARTLTRCMVADAVQTIPVPMDVRLPCASYQLVVRAMSTLLDEVSRRITSHTIT